MLVGPVIIGFGLENTVTATLANEGHNVADKVKVNVAWPGFNPVTTPALFILAIDGLLLTQVPPDVGERLVVEPGQI